jgi:conjugative transposon TraJ protein
MQVENWLTTLLEWCYEAAALVVSTLRCFILTVLSILGPFVLGVSILEGFRSSFNQWLARYINVFLWLPVANIYGAMLAKIQVLMLTMDTSSDFAHNQGAAYIVFLLMGIAGYATVPSTAGYVVQAMGGQALVQRMTALVSRFI